jgi:hypothetical protein
MGPQRLKRGLGRIDERVDEGRRHRRQLDRRGLPRLPQIAHPLPGEDRGEEQGGKRGGQREADDLLAQ